MKHRLLSTWNQIAPRAYVRLWYCFPCRHVSLEVLEQHLALVLSQLAECFPDLGGKIFALSNPTGRLGIKIDDEAAILLKIFNQRDSFGWTYAELRSQCFPARAFVNKSFDLPYQLIEGVLGVPVFEVHVRAIEGGLLLGVYSHHSISDGSGIDNFIGSFAELTRDPARTLEVQYPTDFYIDLPENIHHEDTKQLLGHCPEYCLLPSPTGPTQFHMPETGTPWEKIHRTGRIFVIQDTEIEYLKQGLARVSSGSSQRPPSTFTCVAAITWAHVVKARLSTAGSFPTSSSQPTLPDKPRLLISVSWRRRAFSSTVSASARNTVALPVTSIDTAAILTACNSDRDVSLPALARVTQTADEAISSVVENFVASCTELIRQRPDPRLIGVDVDPRDSNAFYFNTWRYFGAQTSWKIPGLDEEEGDGVAQTLYAGHMEIGTWTPAWCYR